MALIQCTVEEICSVLGISDSTISRRCKEDHKINIEEYIQQKANGGRASLRRMQYKKAQEGNPTMLIWLGKQYLGQKDNLELSKETDREPIRLAYDPKRLPPKEKDIIDVEHRESDAEDDFRSKHKKSFARPKTDD